MAVPAGRTAPAEDVKLKDGDVVVAGEVDGGLEGHGLQRRADGVGVVQRVAELFPRHDDPGAQRENNALCFKTGHLYIYTIIRGSGAQENFVRVFPSQNVVLTRRCSPPLCVHARIRSSYAR